MHKKTQKGSTCSLPVVAKLAWHKLFFRRGLHRCQLMRTQLCNSNKPPRALPSLAQLLRSLQAGPPRSDPPLYLQVPASQWPGAQEPFTRRSGPTSACETSRLPLTLRKGAAVRCFVTNVAPSFLIPSTCLSRRCRRLERLRLCTLSSQAVALQTSTCCRVPPRRFYEYSSPMPPR